MRPRNERLNSRIIGSTVSNSLSNLKSKLIIYVNKALTKLRNKQTQYGGRCTKKRENLEGDKVKLQEGKQE